MELLRKSSSSSIRRGAKAKGERSEGRKEEELRIQSSWARTWVSRMYVPGSAGRLISATSFEWVEVRVVQ